MHGLVLVHLTSWKDKVDGVLRFLHALLLCGSRCAWHSVSSIHKLENWCQRQEENLVTIRTLILCSLVLCYVLKCLLKTHSGGFPSSGGGI